MSAAGRVSVLLASVLLAGALASALLTAGGGGAPEARADAPAATAAPAVPARTPAPTAIPVATSTPTPTPAPPLEEQVRAAYLAYWEAYAAAVLELDPSLAAEVAAGAELDRIRSEIASLRARGLALRVVVEHDALVVPTGASTAVVVDHLTNRSFYVDPQTKHPPRAEGGGEVLRDTVFLERRDGRWIVVDSRREPAP